MPFGTRAEFDRVSKVASETLRVRFGTWRQTLATAGLENRFDDSSESWSREKLIDELRRVAALIPDKKLSCRKFDRLSKVKAKTLCVRFGDWRKALAAAGFENRFDDRTKSWTREEIIERLKSITERTGHNSVTREELSKDKGPSAGSVRLLFGSYRAAIEAAGLSQSKNSVRYTDEECYENLLAVWTALGRQPSYGELSSPPSKIGPNAYESRWGSWRKALKAFIDRVNQDTPPEVQQADIYNAPCPPFASNTLTVEVKHVETYDVPSDNEIKIKRSSRNIPLGLRYKVLVRDRFRCVIDGRSPATHPVTLHVDHFKPWAGGGETVLENLRTLCSDCNLGKGCREEEVINPESTASGTDPSTSSG